MNERWNHKEQITPKPEGKENHQTDKMSIIKQSKAAEDMQGVGDLPNVSRNIIRADIMEMTMEAPQSTKSTVRHHGAHL